MGGNEIPPHSLPFQVHLTYDRDFQCGGVIISAYFILTAAHCLRGKNLRRLTVYAGDHNLQVEEGEEQIKDVEWAALHSNYEDFEYDFDIAVIKVYEPFNFNKFVGSIKFPKRKTMFDGKKEYLYEGNLH